MVSTKSKWDFLVIGLALFAIFFGAGNLIFPPFLGMTAGDEWPAAFGCFVLIDVVITCLGLFALNRAGGSTAAIEGTLGRRAGLLINSAAVLCTGVIIASPRTAATTFEMTVIPLAGDAVGLLPFSLVFFAVVFALTIRQSKVVDIIGKILTPLLVAAIVVLVAVGIASPIGPIGTATSTTVAQDGISAGYQAMDILCIAGFAVLLQDAVISHGHRSRRSQLPVVTKACLVAAVLLTLIYGGLTYLGATASLTLDPALSQAQLLVQITRTLLGGTGVLLLGVIVGLACLTTAIGLIGASAAFFERVTGGKLRYPVGVVIAVTASILICNLGLTNIINLASPILAIICPPYMITVVLLLFIRHIHSTWVFKGAAGGALVASVAITLHTTFGVWGTIEALPLYSFGFAWLPPALAGALAGWMLSYAFGYQNDLVRDPLHQVAEEARTEEPCADVVSAKADADFGTDEAARQAETAPAPVAVGAAGSAGATVVAAGETASNPADSAHGGGPENLGGHLPHHRAHHGSGHGHGTAPGHFPPSASPLRHRAEGAKFMVANPKRQSPHPGRHHRGL